MRTHYLAGAFCALFLLSSAKAAKFTVTSALDSGAGTLREAITNANVNPGPDRIEFSLTPASNPMITVGSVSLPEITDPVTIDGSTQPTAGYVEINGNSRGIYGFLVTSSNCVFKRLVINNMGNTSGLGIWLKSPGGGNVITGCIFGADPTGTIKRRIRGDCISIVNSPNNRIGGTLAEERNIICGSFSSAGISILGTESEGNLIQGNYIGIGSSGTNIIVNFSSGVEIEDAPGNLIGGDTPEARNVIAGSGSQQIRISGTNAPGNVIRGNYIGIAANGTALSTAPASGNGIRIEGIAGTIIGGASTAHRNVISGNNYGILVINAGANGTQIQGNYVGTGPDGATAIANQYGISLGTGSSGSMVGGADPLARNVVCANRVFGIGISDSSNHTVQGNYVGVNATGTVALSNTTPGTSGSGISINSLNGSSTNNLIGGTAAGAGNVVSGNNSEGITISGEKSTDNFVQGNLIGFTAGKSAVLGNFSEGIAVLGANRNTIGGSDAGARNFIAGNGTGNLRKEGVFLGASFGTAGNLGTNNLVIGNSIGNNGGPNVTLLGANEISQNEFFGTQLDIDRGGDGPTPNVAGSKANYPVITSAHAQTLAGDLAGKGKKAAAPPPTVNFTISGSVAGEPNCLYVVQIFAELDEDFGPLGTITARKFIGQFEVTADAAGIATFTDKTVSSPFGYSSRLFATAYSPTCSEETSELGPGATVQAGGSRVTGLKQKVVNATEGQSVVFEIVRTGDLSQESSVTFTAMSEIGLAAGTTAAVDGVDYTARTVTVGFAVGQNSATVSVPTIQDGIFSGTRTFRAKLSDPVNTGLGLAASVGAIIDDDAPGQALKAQFEMTGGAGVVSERTDVGPKIVEATWSLDPSPMWRQIGLIPPDGRKLPIDMNEWDKGFFRLAVGGPVGWGHIELKDKNGAAPGGFQTMLGYYGIGIPISGDVIGYTKGNIDVVAEKTVEIKDSAGVVSTFQNYISLGIVFDAVNEAQAALKADFQADVSDMTAACSCKPWAGAMAGTIDGAQKIVLAGGANGKCGEQAAVRITGPGGVDVTLGAGQRRRTFDPAANGTWTVSSTVCGTNKTVTLTLP